LYDKNLQRKQIKKHVSPSSFAHFHLTNHDVLNEKLLRVSQNWTYSRQTQKNCTDDTK